jgi:hypothetical protein
MIYGRESGYLQMKSIGLLSICIVLRKIDFWVAKFYVDSKVEYKFGLEIEI